jgi:hypothetical protein
MAKAKPTRRSALDAWPPTVEPGEKTIPATLPPSPLDLISAKQHKRRREWEKTHRARPYRGVPSDLHEQTLALASSLDVNTDEVVQVFVQYGLACVEKSVLTINARPKSQRMTLFPTPRGWSAQAGWSEADGWAPGKSKEIPAKSKSHKNDKGEKPWQHAPGYRLPSEVHESVKKLAQQHFIPIGEVMTLFLKHGLESYKSGRLHLNPQPKTVRMTIAESVS